MLVKDRILTLIPYYAWAHRGTGNMAVWLPDEVNATRPKAIPTLASKSKIDASHKIPTLFSVADGLIPQDENDRTIPYYHWYPKTGTTEWISYEFPEEVQVSTSTVYWFDDTPWGSCSIPKSWKIYYKNTEGKWLPVENLNAYSIVKGEGSAVKFKTVKTKAIKLEVVLPDEKTAGIYEWQVK